MSLCPKCHRNYHSKVNFCPVCNVPLSKATQAAGEPSSPTGETHEAGRADFDAPPALNRHGESAPAASSSDRLAEEVTTRDAGTFLTGIKQEIADALREGASPTADVTDVALQDLEWSINLNRILIEGSGTALEMKLLCHSPDPLLDVHVEVLSEKALTQPFEEGLPLLERAQPVSLWLEIDFIERCMGVRLLNCFVHYTRLGRRKSLKGQLQITILKEPAAGDFHLELSNIGNQIVNGASNAGLGSEHESTVSLKELVDFGSIRNVNDLLSATLPDNFVSVVLRQISDAPIAARTIAPPFLKKVQEGKVLTLTPVESGTDTLQLHVSARPQFLIGRQRDVCDFIAWFLPRSPENDELTRSMSKTHVIFQADEESIFVRCLPGVKGVTLNGTKVTDDEPGLPFETHGHLSMQAVAGPAFDINVQHHVHEGSAPPVAVNSELWPGPPAQEKNLQGCVVFAPVKHPAAFRNCVWLFTEASFGGGEGNAIRLFASDIASTQGRIHHYRGCFWIENSADTGTVRVDGHLLRSGELAPLCSDMTLGLGNLKFAVHLQS